MHEARSGARGSMHLNADWVILEPVDRAYRPVPPGVMSHTVLLTNLANRVQPIIRYDLGDSVVIEPDPCAVAIERDPRPIAVSASSGKLLRVIARR